MKDETLPKGPRAASSSALGLRRSVARAAILITSLLAEGVGANTEAKPPVAPGSSTEPVGGTSGEEADGVLELADVLASVRAHHPRIGESLARQRGAEFEQLRARGNFDPVLSAQGKVTTNGYYELRRGDVELRQPTGLWGAQFFAGYRIGLGAEGRYPTYYSDETLSGGEVRAGVEVPLWRDGPLDPARAEVRRAGHSRRAAEQHVATTRLELDIDATRAYWQWVAAGQRARIARDLLALAERRDVFLKRRAERGAVPQFDVTDNRRMVIERSEQWIAARRSLEEAAFRLSLFLRDARGGPLIPREESVPRDPPPLPAAGPKAEDVLGRVLACHPALVRVRAELAAVRVDQELAESRVAPELTARVQLSRDMGPVERNPSLQGNVVDAGLRFSLPLLLRGDRGRAGMAQARVLEKKSELEWLEDRIRAALFDAASQLDAATRRASTSGELVDVSEELAAGERRRFESGDGQLLFVNLREQAAADAAMRYASLAAAARLANYEWQRVAEMGCAERDAPSR